ncbi:MAG: ABC transporter permease [Alphaproteobacteria bacterium]|nr:ABC transporter permease [Alphaproteobacteria bacterium]
MRRGRLGGRILEAALAIFGVAVIAFLLLPIVVIIPMSFNAAPVFEIIPSQLSVSQYQRLFASPEWLDVLWRSIRIAAIAMVVATTVGTLAALGIARLGWKARSFIEALLISPQIVPSIVIAAAAYYMFAMLGLVGSITGVVVMHALIALPFVVILVQSRLQSISPDFAQASASLGAGPLRTFALITLPQLRLALIGAGVLAFHVSFDEVVLALFLSGARTKTLPVKLWDSILFEVSPLLPAISALVILIPLVVIAPVMWLQRRARTNSEAGEA